MSMRETPDPLIPVLRVPTLRASSAEIQKPISATSKRRGVVMGAEVMMMAF